MIKASLVKELREKTGAGMMECKRALVETGGDLEKAVDFLRKSGAAKAAKKAIRAANDGVISTYIHPGSRLGVLLEINCETDFVANTDIFQTFARDVAMHIAAASPVVVTRDQMPDELIAREKTIYQEQAKESGKPADIAEKIVAGRLDKFYAESALLEQAFVKDPQKTITQYLEEVITRLGENIVITRFVRFELGEASGNGQATD
ncbi:MAG: translation elongation factor Ts [Candidatus Marinimicrobia bacterium]|nr:translation elongation factor Ts [Candidatus Neomarinimicrobiota bacterium]